MAQTITFYPLGNAETCMVELSNGKKLLFDFANMKTSDDSDLRSNLMSEFSSISKFDVVMFTHAHEDHVKGSSEFFYLEHAKKYQDDTRVKIEELWISSAFILDTELESEDAKIIRQEARYRLKQKSGIKVFAKPNSLTAWLEANDLLEEDVSECIVHAGEIMDTSYLGSEIQFFIHAPFSDECEDVDDKNEPSIVFQMRLFNMSTETNVLITGDTPHTILSKIVEISKHNDNEGFLRWDIYDIPHHCSYTGLGDNRGDYKTTPTENIKWLLSQGEVSAKMVAPCDIITNETSPPHIQAKRAYETYTADDITFYATMEYPNKRKPSPLSFTVNQHGLSLKTTTSASILKSAAPRAGEKD